MSPLFRSGLPADVPAAARLAAHSFPAVGRSLAEWEAALSAPPAGAETLWVGEEEGRILAACNLFSFRQWIGGVELPIMGLGTVAISPSARRRGLAGQLVASGLREARQRGEVASALYPFRTAFYRKLGYGLAGEVLQYRIPPAVLPDDPGRLQVRIMESERDREGAVAVYDRWVRGQTGQLARSPATWERLWQGEREGALYEREGEPIGYAIFRYTADLPRGGRTLEVEEIAWLDRSARRALYGWLGSLSDQWDQLLYRAHPEENFADHLSEVRFPFDGIPRWHFWFPTAVVLNGPMFRLLDVAAAWALRRIEPSPPLTLALEIEDPVLAENAGAWMLELAGGAASLERRSPGRADARMKIGIEALSRIFIGALTPSEAVRADRAEIDDAGRLPDLDRLLRLPRPWTFDRF